MYHNELILHIDDIVDVNTLHVDDNTYYDNTLVANVLGFLDLHNVFFSSFCTQKSIRVTIIRILTIDCGCEITRPMDSYVTDLA